MILATWYLIGCVSLVQQGLTDRCLFETREECIDESLRIRREAGMSPDEKPRCRMLRIKGEVS